MEVCRCLATIFALQAICCALSEKSCSPGFDSEIYTFKVDSVTLHVGGRLGKVVFDDCTSRTQTVFDTTDERFAVDTDGTVRLKKQLTLLDGLKRFSVHGWDSQGKKHTVAVHVELNQPHHYQQHHPVDLHQRDPTEVIPTVPVLMFPQSSGGLKRRKRDWIIPPISMSENSRGPFPQKMVQIKTSLAKELKIIYSITGQGADQPPTNLFTIDRETGQLYVTQPLDREKQAYYTLFAHAVTVGGQTAEEPMEIKVIVIDQNDNRPIFTKDPFLGSVAESSPIGTEFMEVVATDADEPGNANSDIRYRIMSQDPPLPQKDMFAINPLSGKIRVKTAGLDKETVAKYILEIEVGDNEGDGLTANCKAIITIIDSDVNAAQLDPSQCSEMATPPPSPLSTHVLNTGRGVPGAGMALSLHRLDSCNDTWELLITGVTNDDGRCPGLITREAFKPAIYKMRFETGQYWEGLGENCFYPYVEIVFEITDSSQKFHVPLLLSRFSYSTYRGS